MVAGMEADMTTRKILKAFGFELWRNESKWVAACPGKSFSAEYLRDLIEEIVPQPAEILTADALKAWGEACRVACYRQDIDPKDLAKAAFAAYDIDSPDEFVECFISAWDDLQR